ncbi:hypothetical protein [Aquabacter sediminis]|uniref:hypothetical protein n=1 Tax=Aquabacter sediminis TaxID=3029197 RepID=UPI00237D7660|nr:hypothetical protein [Aquabacter sp. P-9]MDE1567341.1 hypothetical protein [Aquabacter sp. P-9]
MVETTTPKTKPKPKAKATVAPAVHCTDVAPTCFFETAGAFSHSHGVYTLMLTTGFPVPMADGTVQHQNKVAAYVKGNRSALLSMRDAIDKALLAGVPTAGHAPS